jgi:hypothetical protein
MLLTAPVSHIESRPVTSAVLYLSQFNQAQSLATPLFSLLQFGGMIAAFIPCSLLSPQCSPDGLGCPSFEHNLRNKTGISKITIYLITVNNTNKKIAQSLP